MPVTQSHADGFFLYLIVCNVVFYFLACSELSKKESLTCRFVSSVKLRQQRELLEPAAQEEDREEEISGAQFLCETVIRSLTLEEAPDHRPLRRSQPSKAAGEFDLPPPQCQ